MMSLSKMAPLAWRYDAEEVAAGREDYFAAGAERPGRFLGRGAQDLGIGGTEVTSEAMERLVSRGCDPQLHTHVLVANKVRAKDGHWLSSMRASCSATRRPPECSTRRRSGRS